MKQNIVIGITTLTLFGLSSLALADALPKRTSDYNGNYQTLVNDQHAAPDVASCIATARDLTKSAKQKYDRLGFTADDLQKAKITKAQILVQGEARLRKSGKWNAITVQCGLKSGKITALKLQDRK